MNKHSTVLRLLHESMDIFRNFGAASEIPGYISAIFFYKYLCDDEKTLQALGKTPRFLIPVGWSFDDLLWRRSTSEFSKIMTMAFSRVAEINTETLEGVFEPFASVAYLTTIRAPRDWDKAVKDVFELISYLNLAEPELAIGESFIAWLEYNATNNKYFAPEFTPLEIDDLLVRLVQPQARDEIYDPACGTGTTLVHAAKAANNNVLIWGQDINPYVCSIAKMNMILNGIIGAKIFTENTLTDPRFLEGHILRLFDVVLCDLPFGMSNWGSERLTNDPRFFRGLPPRSHSEWAFITHIVESIKDNGRAAVVVPMGVLFRSGTEASIRKSLIDENLIDAVIQLPSNLLLNTTVAISIIVIKKHRDHDDILFIDAGAYLRKNNSTVKFPSFEIDHIVDAFHSRQDQPYVRRVSRDQLRDNSSLMASHYTSNSPQAPDIAQLELRLASLTSELSEVRNRISRYFR